MVPKAKKKQNKRNKQSPQNKNRRIFHKEGKAKLALIMGSKSDLKVMSEAVEVLEHFKVPYEISIVSAHRTPQWMFSWSEGARKKGIEVIIAGAGGSAHLPGMVASISLLPTLGVAIYQKKSMTQSKQGGLEGLDALLSIVQMPKGCPVACTGINGAENAAFFALQILSLKDKTLAKKLRDYHVKQQKEVYKDNQKLKILSLS